MKKILIPVFTIALLFATSCKKEFFDINKNPNFPTEESITPQVLLPRILHTVGQRTGTSFDYAAQWSGYWAHSGSYGQSIELESYAITASFQATQWSNWYDILYDVYTMEKQATVLQQPFYIAAAKTIKAIAFMNLVDQYNNVPYSKAFLGVGNVTPAYDKAEDIYNDLFVQLKDAANLFKTAATAVTPDANTTAADIMFGTQGYNHGADEALLWRKLINTMRLKLLIHMSQLPTTAAKAATVVADINADGAGYLGAGQTASVNPGYTAVNTKQNPFWDSYKLSGLQATDQYNRASTYMLTKSAGANGRLGANNPGFNTPSTATPAQVAQITADGADDDLRYLFNFTKATTPLAVPQYGFPAQTPTPQNNYIGAQFGEVVPNADAYKQQNQSDIAGPGLAKSPTQSQPVLTGIESLFLQAEAAGRGWIAGDATVLTTTAITESFTYLGVNKDATGAAITPAAAATAYIANRNVATNVTAAAIGDAKAKVIVFEKYLSLFGLDFLEAYTDYRRLGVPTDLPLSLNGARVTNVIPLRLQYPQAEFNYNPANVNAQGVINPQTSAIFWDR